MFFSTVPQVLLACFSVVSSAGAFVAVHHLPRELLPAMSALTELGHSKTAATDRDDGVANALATQTAVQGLGEMVSQYESFLIDQWGVMHDGKTPYPGAVECINRLAAAGKKIVLLSNSSKRKSAAFRNLKRMGFSTDSVLDVVTSGEIAWEGLNQRKEEPFKSLGMKCLVFGNGEDDLEYVSSCGCELAEAKDADFILARGSFVVVGSEGTRRHSPTVMTGEGKQETDNAMRVMLDRGAHMLVTNPDFLRPGTNDPMPGLIGKAYAEMGGTVHYVGKPHAAVYEACFEALQQDDAPGTGGKASATVDLSSVVGVGDSLPHDILGAQRAGISSVFVAGGVHFEELGVRQGAGDVPDDDACSVAFLKHLEGRGTPTHTVPAFRW